MGAATISKYVGERWEKRIRTVAHREERRDWKHEVERRSLT